MTRLLHRFILFGILSLLLFASPADAGVPLPSEVANDIVEPEQTELIAQRAELLIRRDSIKLRVAIHNVKCSKVAPGSRIVEECRMDQAKLQTDISDYTAHIHAFNTLVQDLPRLTETGLDPWLSNNMLYYFLVSRAENYTIHNAIMRGMIHENTAGPQERLANLLDETEELRDRELLKPLDYEMTLDISEAAQVVNDRLDARIREAARRYISKMSKVMRNLEEEGVLEPGESVTEKKRDDPIFRERLNSMLSIITKDELTNLRSARRKALDEIIRIIETRSSQSNYQEFHELLQETIERHDTTLELINKFAFRELSDEMDRLKQEDYYKDGDDLIQMDRYDPDFRNAVNEAVRNVLLRQYKAEQQIQLKTLKEIQSIANNMRLQ